LVAITTGYGLKGPESNPDGRMKFSLLHAFPDQPWGPPTLLYNGHGGSFRGIKVLGLGVDHSVPYNAG